MVTVSAGQSDALKFMATNENFNGIANSDVGIKFAHLNSVRLINGAANSWEGYDGASVLFPQKKIIVADVIPTARRASVSKGDMSVERREVSKGSGSPKQTRQKKRSVENDVMIKKYTGKGEATVKTLEAMESRLQNPNALDQKKANSWKNWLFGLLSIPVTPHEKQLSAEQKVAKSTDLLGGAGAMGYKFSDAVIRGLMEHNELLRQNPRIFRSFTEGGYDGYFRVVSQTTGRSFRDSEKRALIERSKTDEELKKRLIDEDIISTSSLPYHIRHKSKKEVRADQMEQARIKQEAEAREKWLSRIQETRDGYNKFLLKAQNNK